MENSPGSISINPDNISKYGFVCFSHKCETDIKDHFWIRDVEVIGGTEHTIRNFKIREEFLIELPDSEKIIHSKNFKIDSTAASIEIIKLLSERAGWNQTEEDLKSMHSHGKKGVFIANYTFKNHEIPLGSGVSLSVNEKLGWIGMILVHPELRRQGVARSIMNTCLEHARLYQKKSIVGLDATPLGKQVYDALGFKNSFTIWRSIIDTNWVINDISKYAILPADNFSVKKYLIEKNYPERIGIIELLMKMPGSVSIMSKSEHGICGFVMSRPGRIKPFVGPLIADSKEVALELLGEVLNSWKSNGYEDVFMDIPEYHLSDSIFSDKTNITNSPMKQIPVKPSRSLIRMYQLVSKVDLDGLSKKDESKNMKIVLQKALDSHVETATFMEKEKHQIVPMMFGTAGPEWS